MTENKRFEITYKGKEATQEQVHELIQKLYEENVDLRKMSNNLFKENKELKQELFQSEKEYLYEAYAGNSVRRDNKIKALEDEFNERFGENWR